MENKINLVATVVHEVGLHARPAAQFVALSSKFRSSIRVRNLTTKSEWVDAKSILSVLTLGVEANHQVELELVGQDAVEGAKALQELIDSNFATITK